MDLKYVFAITMSILKSTFLKMQVYPYIGKHQVPQTFHLRNQVIRILAVGALLIDKGFDRAFSPTFSWFLEYFQNLLLSVWIPFSFLLAKHQTQLC